MWGGCALRRAGGVRAVDGERQPSSIHVPSPVVHRVLPKLCTPDEEHVTRLEQCLPVHARSQRESHCRDRFLIRLVNSVTWLKIDRRSAISDRILQSACITVVWSRPPNV